MKRLNLFALLFLLTIVVEQNAFGADFCVDGIYYNKLTATTVEVMGADAASEVIIPKSIEYDGIKYSVTSIGRYAFCECSSLTSVTIPNSVTSIGDDAFSGCYELTSISIPNSVTSIGYEAFNNCSRLNSVNIGNSVTSIGGHAFSGCSGLTSVTIPNSVTSIGEGAFSGCYELTSISIPNSVTSIGGAAFMDTPWYNNQEDGLIYAGNIVYTYKGEMPLNTEIVLKDGTVGISDEAFRDCRGLNSISIPNSVTNIGSSAFYGCSGLNSVNIPNSVTSIGRYAFFNCRRLNSITIPNSVTSIGECAFNRCDELTSISIPNSVTSIGEGAFMGTSWYNNQEDGLIYAGNIVYTYKGEMPLNTEIVLKDGTVGICDNAFSGRSGLTSISIPNSVTSIGSYAFRGCSGLNSVIIGNSVTSIGVNAFSGCSGLTSVTIPNSVTSIGSYAFRGCSRLNSVIIGNSVTSIGEYAFSGCSGLNSVTIPNSVISIGSYAFSGCSELNSANIGNSVTSIGSYAFSGCSGLNSVTIPNSVTSIGGFAFMECSGLNSVNIGNSVTSIGDDAFSGCSGLNSVTIPNSVISIGSYAFRGCSELNSVTIPNSVTSIGEFAFGNCSGLTSVTLNSNRIVSAPYNYLYNLKSYFGSQVKEYVLGTDVTSIGSYAFYGCNGLTSITIHNSVTNIGNDAFRGCSGLFTTKASSISLNLCFESGSPLSPQAYLDSQPIELANGSTIFTGLEPTKKYQVSLSILGTDNIRQKVISQDITTPDIELTSSLPKVTKSGEVIVAAMTNLVDEETNVGFEWRKTDAPDDMPSKNGYGVIYNGRLEAVVKNLNASSYYRVRPFYKSNEGNEYYGDWIAFDPSDFSYFEPTVHTYDHIIVEGNKVNLTGYVLSGTDNIEEQGFEVWIPLFDNSTKQCGSEDVNNLRTITATGQRMTASMDNLEYNTTYTCRSYAKTSTHTYYGEEIMFTTGEAPTGIEDVYADKNTQESVTIVACYNINGQPIATPQKGMNILRMSDGTVRKVYVK